jgi:DUF1680 family protein
MTTHSTQLPFWDKIRELNNSISIFHQWDELERSGCIDNFRIVSGEKDGFREGWVFADSDAYKWLDAACKIYKQTQSANLLGKIDQILSLILTAQTEDGYIFTYNQFHFPTQRWVNLQIEHELYCLGHLIEGCISHFRVFHSHHVLAIATRTADLLVRDFLGEPAIFTDGHEEIELALIKLFEVTQEQRYLDLADHFLSQRGRSIFYGIRTHFQKNSSLKRKSIVNQQRTSYLADHPNFRFSVIPQDNDSENPPFSKLKRKLEELSGKYFQQHAPLSQQKEPVGHSVRFGYLEAAASRIQKFLPNKNILSTQEVCWDRMISSKMYITGGLGSFSWNEGFGKDYELDPGYAYNETCAAIASILWSQQMGELTDEAKYFDLMEWQIYNAMLVGLGMDGESYLYNNPLEVAIDIQRRNWFSVPCCPPNLSRTICDLEEAVYHLSHDRFFLDQFIPKNVSDSTGVAIRSEFPFSGKVWIQGLPDSLRNNFFIRIPSWVRQNPSRSIIINGEPISIPEVRKTTIEKTASGYDPRISEFFQIPLEKIWGESLSIEFPIKVNILRAHPKVKGHDKKIAVTRGPLVYCLESIDNPTSDIFSTIIDTRSFTTETVSLFGIEVIIIKAKNSTGEQLTLIPYFLWGNRGSSKMTVWINSR